LKTSPEQIEQWLARPSEDQNLEFKEAKTQFDNTKLYKYCVALANEGGGILLMGVTDVVPRRVVGTSAFNDIVDMAAKIFTKIGFRVDLEEVSHVNGRVLVFKIPSRPSGTLYNYQGSYLMRSGEELVPMSEDQLRKIFAEGKPDWLGETAKEGVTSQDIIQLLDTQAFFDLLNRPYPSDQVGVIDFLLKETLIARINSSFSITNLGAVLLAKDLKSFSNINRKAARIIVYGEDSKLRTISDKIEKKGYAVGFQDLLDYIMGQLPQNEVIEGAIRKETKLVSKVAIREVLANALIHQDFSMTGVSPMIEIYSNRVEITNPGTPVVPVERFIDGYQSRNERLADIMRRLGICEEKSSGIDRVVQTAEIMQLPPPDFLAANNRTEVVIYGAKPFKNMDRSERVRACYQHCVLQYVLRKQMTNQSLRDRFGLSERSGNTVSTIIGHACEQKLVKLDPTASDSKKYARYIPKWA